MSNLCLWFDGDRLKSFELGIVFARSSFRLSGLRGRTQLGRGIRSGPRQSISPHLYAYSEMKDAPLARLALDPDAAGHQLGELLSDRQTEAGSTVMARH